MVPQGLCQRFQQRRGQSHKREGIRRIRNEEKYPQSAKESSLAHPARPAAWLGAGRAARSALEEFRRLLPVAITGWFSPGKPRWVRSLLMRPNVGGFLQRRVDREAKTGSSTYGHGYQFGRIAIFEPNLSASEFDVTEAGALSANSRRGRDKQLDQPRAAQSRAPARGRRSRLECADDTGVRPAWCGLSERGAGSFGSSKRAKLGDSTVSVRVPHVELRAVSPPCWADANS